MKKIILLISLIILLSCVDNNSKVMEEKLYHIVLFQFKETTTNVKIEAIKKAALELRDIKGVNNLTWA